MVEYASDEILKTADSSDVVFLVVGDPFGYGKPFPKQHFMLMISGRQHIPTWFFGLES